MDGMLQGLMGVLCVLPFWMMFCLYSDLVHVGFVHLCLLGGNVVFKFTCVVTRTVGCSVYKSGMDKEIKELEEAIELNIPFFKNWHRLR